MVLPPAAIDFQYRDPERGFDRSRVKGVVAKLVRVADPSTSTALEVAAGGKLDKVPYEQLFNSFTGAQADGAAVSSSCVVFLLICVLLNFVLIYRGLSKGIEKFCLYAMPALILCALLVLGERPDLALKLGSGGFASEIAVVDFCAVTEFPPRTADTELHEIDVERLVLLEARVGRFIQVAAERRGIGTVEVVRVRRRSAEAPLGPVVLFAALVAGCSRGDQPHHDRQPDHRADVPRPTSGCC